MNANATKPTPSWRDLLPIHPACELFPPMSPDELRALGEDIAKNGLTSPIVLWRADKRAPAVLLDGRNRLDAIEANTGCQVQVVLESIHKRSSTTLWSIKAGEWINDDKVVVLDGSVDPYAYVISANIRRRHLSIEDKDKLIIQLLKADPTKSNRTVAKLADTSHPHVAKVREQAEKSGDVETVTTSIDTKGRRQPASKGNRSRVSVRPQRTPADRPNCTDKISLDSLGEVEHLPPRSEIEPLRGPTTEASGPEASELNDLLRAWDRASETARRAFVARVGLQRVDVA